MAKLEDFIHQNREAFNDKEPPESIWKKIQDEIPSIPSPPWYDNLMVWRAAAVLFMGISIYLLLPTFSQVPDNDSVAVSEFNDVEAFYTTQISQKVALIEQISQGEEGDAFTQDFQQLEAMYSVLKEEWKSSPSRKVKDAMVLNLLVRINLLNQQLHQLEEELKKEDEATDASS